MKKIYTLLSLLIVINVSSFAQVGIGTTTPNVNAILDLNGGTNKGLLLPRLTGSQITALSSAPDGMIVYNTSNNFLYVRKSSAWQRVNDSTNSFSLPYVGSISTAGNAFYLTNNIGNGLAAQTLGTGGYGVYGYAASGYGIDGESYTGTGGYFTSASGAALVTDNGNVGIGTTAPATQLHVISASSEAVRIQATAPYISFYSGTAYKGFLWYSGTDMRLESSAVSALPVTIAPANKINTTFLSNGNVGIGVTTPSLGLLQTRGTVGAVAAMFGETTYGVAIENNYPGIGFNSYYNGGRKAISNGYAGLLGLDPIQGTFSIYSSAGLNIGGAGAAIALTNRLIVKPDGSIGIQGNTNPYAPLSFASSTGNKISLWGDANGTHYGLGIQGGLMQLYTSASGADIAFGYGSSGSFTEN